MTSVVFFNNKGGVGKTTLVYHLAWMYAELGVSTIAADLDPQANLTSMFLDDDRLEELWPDGDIRRASWKPSPRSSAAPVTSLSRTSRASAAVWA